MTKAMMEAHTCVTVDCELCGSSFLSEEALNQHLKETNNHGVEIHKCSICGKMFGARSALNAHYQGEHNTGSTSTMGSGISMTGGGSSGNSSGNSATNSTLNDTSTFLREPKEGLGGNAHFQREDALYASSYPSNKHQPSSTTTNPPYSSLLAAAPLAYYKSETYTCHVCKMEHPSKYALDAHVRSMHAKNKKNMYFKCEDCTNSYTSQNSLDNHACSATGKSGPTTVVKVSLLNPLINTVLVLGISEIPPTK